MKLATLSSGVTTRIKKNRITVELSDYDTYFDQPTMETELSNNTKLLLSNHMKDIKL